MGSRGPVGAVANDNKLVSSRTKLEEHLTTGLLAHFPAAAELAAVMGNS